MRYTRLISTPSAQRRSNVHLRISESPTGTARTCPSCFVVAQVLCWRLHTPSYWHIQGSSRSHDSLSVASCHEVPHSNRPRLPVARLPLVFLPLRRRSSCGSKMPQTALQRLPLSVREETCRKLIEPGKNIPYEYLRICCGTLAALARTCKLFHDPSLNVLWHSIPDIYVLFYSLPSTCYQIQVINGDRPQVVSLISTSPRSCRAC